MQNSYWSPLAPSEQRAAIVEDYYPWFDWLRASLAVIVMLGHDGMIGWEHSGAFAVQTFFALSGFLIGGILLKVQKSDLPRFFFNRAIRIWIPYYIALGFLIVASLLRDHITPKWGEFVGYDLLMVWNWFGTSQLAVARAEMPLHGVGNHFATVHAESQFYLLCPLLLVLAPRWGRSMWLWLTLALAAWFTSIYAPLMLGVLAAIAAVHFERFQTHNPVRWTLLLISLACGASVLAGLNYFVVAPLLAISIVLLLAVKGVSTPLGVVAGGMSYPLYLNQWIGVFVGNAMLGPLGLRDTPVRQLVSCVFSVALAVALFVWVERRMLERRRQWFSALRGRLVTVGAYVMVATGLALGLLLQAR